MARLPPLAEDTRGLEEKMQTEQGLTECRGLDRPTVNQPASFNLQYGDQKKVHARISHDKETYTDLAATVLRTEMWLPDLHILRTLLGE